MSLFPVVVEAHVSHQQNFAVGEEAREFAVSLLQIFTSEHDEMSY